MVECPSLGAIDSPRTFIRSKSEIRHLPADRAWIFDMRAMTNSNRELHDVVCPAAITNLRINWLRRVRLHHDEDWLHVRITCSPLNGKAERRQVTDGGVAA